MFTECNKRRSKTTKWTQVHFQYLPCHKSCRNRRSKIYIL